MPVLAGIFDDLCNSKVPVPEINPAIRVRIDTKVRLNAASTADQAYQSYTMESYLANFIPIPVLFGFQFIGLFIIEFLFFWIPFQWFPQLVPDICQMTDSG